MQTHAHKNDFAPSLSQKPMAALQLAVSNCLSSIFSNFLQDKVWNLISNTTHTQFFAYTQRHNVVVVFCMSGRHVRSFYDYDRIQMAQLKWYILMRKQSGFMLDDDVDVHVKCPSNYYCYTDSNCKHIIYTKWWYVCSIPPIRIIVQFVPFRD